MYIICVCVCVCIIGDYATRLPELAYEKWIRKKVVFAQVCVLLIKFSGLICIDVIVCFVLLIISD